MNADNKIEKIFNILEKSPSFLKESNNIEFQNCNINLYTFCPS